MLWNDNKDEILRNEVLAFEPYHFKARSYQRGNAGRAQTQRDVTGT